VFAGHMYIYDDTERFAVFIPDLYRREKPRPLTLESVLKRSATLFDLVRSSAEGV